MTNSTRELLWFAISKMLIAVKKNKFIVSLIIIFSTLVPPNNNDYDCIFSLSAYCKLYCISSMQHTHPFNGPLSGTTQVSQYQKGKTNLDFTGARDSEWQWYQLGPMQVCTSLQTDNHSSTPPLSFLQAGCPSCRPTNSVNHGRLAAVAAYCCRYSMVSVCVCVDTAVSCAKRLNQLRCCFRYGLGWA